VAETVILSKSADEAKRLWREAGESLGKDSAAGGAPAASAGSASADKSADRADDQHEEARESLSSQQDRHGADAITARAGSSDTPPVQASDPRSATIDRGDVSPASPGAAGDEAAARNSD
jgi:hypothetical protein